MVQPVTIQKNKLNTLQILQIVIHLKKFIFTNLYNP